MGAVPGAACHGARQMSDISEIPGGGSGRAHPRAGPGLARPFSLQLRETPWTIPGPLMSGGVHDAGMGARPGHGFPARDCAESRQGPGGRALGEGLGGPLRKQDNRKPTSRGHSEDQGGADHAAPSAVWQAVKVP